MTDTYTTRPSLAAEEMRVTGTQNYSCINWGSVLAGAVVSLAIFTLLSTFGAAIGLSSTSAIPGKGLSSRAIGIATALWIVWTVVTSFIVGAYFAGRLHHRAMASSLHEAEIRDGAHGLVVWALVSILMAAFSIMSVANSTKILVRSTMTDPFAYTVDKMLRPVAGNAVASPENRDEIKRVFANVAMSGALAADDKAFLQTEIAVKTGVAPVDAAKRVEDAIASAVATAERTRADVEKARKAGILAAFLTAASLAVGAAAAWWAATTGGKHRDEGLSMSQFARWNHRKSIATQARS